MFCSCVSSRPSRFVLNFIPNLGPLIAVLLPPLIVLLDPAISHQAALAAILIPSVVRRLNMTCIIPYNVSLYAATDVYAFLH